MTSWNPYILASTNTLGYVPDMRVKALHAASLSYPGDTDLQSGMVQYNRATGRLEEHDGTAWVPATFGSDAIPSLAASKINSGVFAVARIPSLPASILSSGTLAVARIPSLPASILSSGTLAVARIPSLPASILTSGTLDPARIPSLPASILSSGTVAPARLPIATTSAPGIVEAATLAEVNTGEDGSRFVTPQALADSDLAAGVFTPLLNVAAFSHTFTPGSWQTVVLDVAYADKWVWITFDSSDGTADGRAWYRSAGQTHGTDLPEYECARCAPNSVGLAVTYPVLLDANGAIQMRSTNHMTLGLSIRGYWG